MLFVVNIAQIIIKFFEREKERIISQSRKARKGKTLGEITYMPLCKERAVASMMVLL